MFKRIFGKSLLLAAAVVFGVGIGYTLAAQPRMAAALRALENARGELQAALPDKGGHRVVAIRLVNQAIAQVRLGMADSANQ